jgi:hypothetical protein
MKGFLVLLVLTAGGLAGVFYWRKYIEAHRAPSVAASKPAKENRERHRRKRRGARRLARNEVFVASASPDEAPPSKGAPGEAPPGEGPPPGVYAPPSEERTPLAPGGAATTEVGPSDDVLAVKGPSRSSPAPTSVSRPPVDEPAPIKLRAADLKMIWQGEDLSKTATMHLDLSNDNGHDLSEDEIDARFRTKEDAVLGCVARARPDDYTFIPGRVTVKFRILKTGAVKGVQVEAPVILQKGGLTGCIKGVVGSLRFPASNNGQVISFPFSLM